MFKNKHMTTAMIVAPLLAIGSYFLTDYLVSDLPAVAEDGKAYALIAKPNCRYQSGQCTFRNGDIELDLRLTNLDNGEKVLLARSSHPIKGARVALVANHESTPPLAFLPADQKGESWRLPMTQDMSEKAELRIAMLANDTTFFGSTETTFFEYDTVFPRDNWK